MTVSPQVWLVIAAGVIVATTIMGCGHPEGKASNGSATTVTLGVAANESTSASVDATATSNASTATNAPSGTESADATSSATVAADTAEPSKPNASEVARTFTVEGPESAIRVSFDDIDLLKLMNLDPVPADAPERLPKWLKELDGKRIRVRGFMYPPFQDTDIRGFVLARDNQICCFGRTPKEYDLVDTFLRKGVTTHYIQGRPFDVVGVFHIKSEIEKYTAMYELEDAIVIEK